MDKFYLFGLKFGCLEILVIKTIISCYIIRYIPFVKLFILLTKYLNKNQYLCYNTPYIDSNIWIG